MMSAPPPDRALRRLIADLAVRDAEDVEAILETLQPSQRRRAEALLALCQGQLASTLGEAVGAATVSLGLSPWLAGILEDAEPAGGRAPGEVTEHARQALRDCAQAMSPPSLPAGLNPQLERAGWWRRMRRELLQTRIAI